ncbi:hypothetical protein X777_10175 [Ooceraea biroi]|uniref:Uncharacterized protein n=1 Tax=Ooceraea biroi TaxID=2015173 RepID=A0A026X2L3_OOCBI|nr:hypothetical protein X777_10175 [Ooceraea biroi]
MIEVRAFYRPKRGTEKERISDTILRSTYLPIALYRILRSRLSIENIHTCCPALFQRLC